MLFRSVYICAAIAFIFYLLIPFIGEVASQRSSSALRTRLRTLCAAPEAGYADSLASGGAVSGPDRQLSGRIEGLEGEERLWIRGEAVSAVVDFSHTPLYTLAPSVRDLPLTSTARAASLLKTPWKRVHSLSEGTKLLVAGPTHVEEGRLVFQAEPGRPLFALAYEGSENRLQDELIAGARPGNPVTNTLTLVSWAAGIGVLSIVLFQSSRTVLLPTVNFLEYLITLAPILIFMPPALALLLPVRRLYRRFVSLGIGRDLGIGEARMARIKAYHALGGALLLTALAETGEFIFLLLLWRILRG